jgi:hypothetical protein
VVQIGFAASLTMPAIGLNAVASTGSLIASYPMSETTLAYSALTDTSITLSVNRYSGHQFKVEDRNAQSHVLGSGLVDIGLKKSLQAMKQQISEQAYQNMYASGSAASGSVSGVTVVDHSLALTSEANLKAGFGSLIKAFDKQNVPQEDRFLVMNYEAHGALVQWGGSDMKDANFGSATRTAITAQVPQLYGFKILFDNSVTAGTAVAFNPNAFALAMPAGVMSEIIRDKDDWSNYCRLRIPYGAAPLGAVATTYIDQAIAGQKVGLLRITVT